MQNLNLFEIFTSRLLSINIKFIISGSVASIVYGDPRITHDIDLVIELNEFQIKRIVNLFPIEEFYFPPEEIVNIELNRSNRGHFNIIHLETGFKADIYLSGKDEFLKWALSNPREIKFGETILPIAPIEYVIIKKLEFYKEGKAQKHLFDIAAMLRESEDILDKNFLKNKLQQYDLENEWELIENF